LKEKGTKDYLSRHEREIMDILYQLEEAGVSEVVRRMSGSPSYDSVRITLGILAKKGYVVFRKENRRYIYSPRVPREKASRSAARDLIRTFFEGSPSKAILTMLDVSSDRLSEEEIDRIAEWLEKEKKP
jgi:predicted transcriptional regulator